MVKPSPFQRLTSSLLVIVFLTSAGRELGAGSLVTWIGGIALLIFILIEWRNMALVAQLTFVAAIGIFVIFVSQGQITLELIESAFVRATFFSFFVTSLDILRSTAQTSPMIRHCGKLIIEQPPGRRYSVLTSGGHLFGILLNMGCLNLLGTMIRRSIDTEQDDVEERIREIRLQRMTLAMLRGFTAVPLWAPTSVSVVIVVTGLPDNNWLDMAPFALMTALLFLFTGWVIDRLSFPRPTITAKAGSMWAVLYALLPLLILNVVVLGTAVGLSWLSPLRLIGALLICVPLFGVGWLVVQKYRAGLPVALRLVQRRLGNQIIPGFSDLRSEVGILASSAFISIILLPQIDVAFLSNMIIDNGIGPGALLVATLWFICITGPLGFNPIISVSLAVETLATLPGLHISPYLIMLTCTMAWALVAGVSPFGAALRLACRCTQKSPFEVGPRWNRTFTLTVLLGVSGILILTA